jgi:hypothetical protein
MHDLLMTLGLMNWICYLWTIYYMELYTVWRKRYFMKNKFEYFFKCLSMTQCWVGVNAQYIWVGIKAVDAIFGPMTWHHQGRLFVCVSACKTAKTRRGLAREASSNDQVSQVSKKGEKERVGPSKIDSNTSFYTSVCCMSILPLSTTMLHVDVWYHLWLHLTGLINTEGC